MATIKVRGDTKDISAVLELLPRRKKRIKGASAKPLTADPINKLAQRLHPDKLFLKIEKVKKETKSAKTFTLVPDTKSGTKELPVFRAGQYLSFKVDVGGTRVTRPYSISSSPNDAIKNKFYQITVRKKEGGFATGHIWKKWKAGTRLESSGPCGFFYYEDLRDSKEVVGLAGGCGITPFRSMAKDVVENGLDVSLTILYGITDADDIIFGKELERLAKKAPDRLKVFYVNSEPKRGWKGPKGFLTRGNIRKLAGAPKGKSFFICGPQLMYTFLDKELKPFELPPRRVRREVFGEVADVTVMKGFPKRAAGKTFEMTVISGSEEAIVPAVSTESVLVAMERAGLAPPSQCRSGECGYCNSLLMSGKIFVSPENDGRRAAGVKFGYFHPCSAYPVSDLEVKLPREV